VTPRSDSDVVCYAAWVLVAALFGFGTMSDLSPSLRFKAGLFSNFNSTRSIRNHQEASHLEVVPFEMVASPVARLPVRDPVYLPVTEPNAALSLRLIFMESLVKAFS
jgi:hypothetical protein